MKFFYGLLFSLFVVTSVSAETALSFQAKQHGDVSSQFESPYGKDDVSYGVFVEFFEGIGAWRVGASYSDDVSGIPDVNSVITPQVSLLAVDGIWESGLGALIDYVDTDADADWGDVYFQWTLGINIPVTTSMSIGVHALYPFDDFDGLIDFDSDLLEWSGVVRIRF